MGRPRIPPELRQPRRSGPSGKHRAVEGAELVEQRRRLVEASGMWMDLGDTMPRSVAVVMARLLGQPERSGAQRVQDYWAGRRRYRAVVRIF